MTAVIEAFGLGRLVATVIFLITAFVLRFVIKTVEKRKIDNDAETREKRRNEINAQKYQEKLNQTNEDLFLESYNTEEFSISDSQSDE